MKYNNNNILFLVSMCFYGTAVGVGVGGVVVVGLIGGGVRSVLVHCCKKFSIRLRSLPV